MIAIGVKYVCSVCGQEPIWNLKPLILHIDHISGNWLDNRIENIRFLCPHCHSQTENFGPKISEKRFCVCGEKKSRCESVVCKKCFLKNRIKIINKPN